MSSQFRTQTPQNLDIITSEYSPSYTHLKDEESLYLLAKILEKHSIYFGRVRDIDFSLLGSILIAAALDQIDV